MRRRKGRPPFRRPTDEEIRRLLAARLVSTRIALGVKPQEVLEEIGYTYKKAPRTEKRGLSHEKWVLYRLALLESELTEGRVSLLQRYARAIGVWLDLEVIHSRARQRARMRRVRKTAARRRSATLLYNTRR